MKDILTLVEIANHFSPLASMAFMGAICGFLYRFNRRIDNMELKLRDVFLEKSDFWQYINTFHGQRKE